jgi:hypothetical protein
LTSKAPDAGSSLSISKVIGGRYRILAKLGEGGMGAVYRAEQLSLKRKVALKLLRSELSANPEMVRRFNAEAELAAKLNHPNTVILYDFGQDPEDGSLFIAMEFVEGRSLRTAILREGPLPPLRALLICEQVCASLANAHEAGIIHRDLKPDNVMLSTRGKVEDVVRVLDFGIAKLRDDQGGVTAMPMTKAGDLLGTPQYMAPEQIRGEQVDARTDVYALGAMLYEMITGRLPFEAPSLMAILGKHLSEAPAPPSQRRTDLDIPPALDQLVMECMQKAAADRLRDMELLGDRIAVLRVELERLGPGLAGWGQPPSRPPNMISPPPGAGAMYGPPPGQRPVAVVPMPTPTDGRAAPSRHPASLPRSRGTMWAAIALLLLAGGAGGGYLIYSRRGTNESASAADAQLNQGKAAEKPGGDEPNAGEENGEKIEADDAVTPGNGRKWKDEYLEYTILLPEPFAEPVESGNFYRTSANVDGVPVEIGFIGGSPGGRMSQAELRQQLIAMLDADSVITAETVRSVRGGGRAHGWTVARPGKVEEYTFYQSKGVLVVMYVSVPAESFAGTKAFRDDLFEQRVRLR